MKMLVPLLMAIVAGIGLDDWLNPEQGKRPGTGNRISALIPVLFSLVLFGVIYFVNLFFSPLDIHNSTYRAFIEHLVFQVFNINQPRVMISLVIPVIFLILWLLFWRRLINHAWFGYSILTISLVELLVLAWQYNPVTDKSLVYPEIPIVSLLQQESQPFRTMSTDLSVFPPNAGAAYGIAQIEGYDYPVFQSEFDLYRAQGGDKASHRQVWSINYPLVDWLNIRFVISSRPIQKNGYRLVLDQPVYKVYRNENAYPRAYMVYDYQVIEDRAKLLQTMISSPGILKQKALFNQPPADVPAVNGLLTGGAPPQVEFVDYSMDRALLNIYTPGAGYLVMSDLYTKDWKAKIDGQEAPVLNANYAYRAVYLPEGQHQIEFYYRPASFTIGVTLSLWGLFIIIGVCIFEIYAARRHEKIMPG